MVIVFTICTVCLRMERNKNNFNKNGKLFQKNFSVNFICFGLVVSCNQPQLLCCVCRVYQKFFHMKFMALALNACKWFSFASLCVNTETNKTEMKERGKRKKKDRIDCNIFATIALYNRRIIAAFLFIFNKMTFSVSCSMQTYKRIHTTQQ